MTDTGRADAADVIGELAEDIAQRLAELRRELEPTRDLWSGDRFGLSPAAEWAIAADGLLGPDGVVGLLSDAMKITRPGHTGVGWADAGNVQDGPMRD